MFSLNKVMDIINIIGVVGGLVILIYALGVVKTYLDKKATTTTGTTHNVYQNASNAVTVLQNIAKFTVARLDGDTAPSHEKKAQAMRDLQDYADKHNFKVSVETISGMVETAVNDLRCKQGLPLPNTQNNNSTNNGQTTASQEENEQPVVQKPNDEPQQDAPVNPYQNV